MNSAYIYPDFDDADDYRLLAMEGPWVEQLKQRIRVRQVHGKKRCRGGAPASAGEPSVALVMNGTEQLCARDDTRTWMVRRVEYSNTLLIAHRALRGDDAGAAVDPTVPGTSLPPDELRERAESVVVASAVRLFEAHEAAPQHDVAALLKDALITIDEIERDSEEGSDGPSTAAGGHAARLTFSSLAAGSDASPSELAAMLCRAGALVHRGFVRLLEPACLHQALRAVLTFFDSADPNEMSWSSVRAHFSPTVFPAVVVDAVRSVYGVSGGECADAERATAGSTAANERDEGVVDVSVSSLLDLGRVAIGLAGSVFENVDLDGNGGGAVTEVEGTGRKESLLPHDVEATSMPFEEFFPRWQATIPESLFGIGPIPARSASAEAFLELLAGYVLCIRQRSDSFTGATVWWVPRDGLPNDIRKRLDILFTVNTDRYPVAVIKPYVEPLLPPDQTFTHVMLRYAREFRIPGEPVMYSRLAG